MVPWAKKATQQLRNPNPFGPAYPWIKIEAPGDQQGWRCSACRCHHRNPNCRVCRSCGMPRDVSAPSPFKAETKPWPEKKRKPDKDVQPPRSQKAGWTKPVTPHPIIARLLEPKEDESGADAMADVNETEAGDEGS
eukprot:13838499-Alexandrium_andersonii.AAC.1